MTFVRDVARDLSSSLKKNVETINAGVIGYGPDQELLRMRRDVPRLSPDVLVEAVFADNDYGDLMRDKLFKVDTLAPTNSAALIPAPHHLSAARVDAMVRGGHPTGLHRLMLVRHYDKYKAEQVHVDTVNDPYSPANYIRGSLDLSHKEYDEAVVQGNPTVSNLFRDHYDADIALELQLAFSTVQGAAHGCGAAGDA